MLDIKAVRQDPEGVAAALEKRGFSFDIGAFRALDARRKQADIDSQELLAQRKSVSKKIGQLVGQGIPVEEAKAQVNETLDKIAAQIDALTEQARQAQGELDELLLELPNIPDVSVPDGSSENDNVELSRWGKPRVFDFPIKDHVELGEALGMFDTDTAGKITGSRFTVMYGELARLHRALIQFMLNLHTGEHGYREIYVPYIATRCAVPGSFPSSKKTCSGCRATRVITSFPPRKCRSPMSPGSAFSKMPNWAARGSGSPATRPVFAARRAATAATPAA